MKHTQWSMPLNYGKKYEIQTRGTGICQQVAIINDVVDARLIAAAPELLEALKKARQSLMRRDCCPAGLFEEIEQAISRAEGTK